MILKVLLLIMLLFTSGCMFSETVDIDDDYYYRPYKHGGYYRGSYYGGRHVRN